MGPGGRGRGANAPLLGGRYGGGGYGAVNGEPYGLQEVTLDEEGTIAGGARTLSVGVVAPIGGTLNMSSLSGIRDPMVSVRMDMEDDVDARERELEWATRLKALKEEKTRALPLRSVFNLCVASIGAGLLSFPYAFKDTGVAGGLTVCVVFMVLGGLGLHVLAKAALSLREFPDSYQSLLEAIIGRKVAVFATLTMLLYLAGSCIVYLTVVGNLLSPLIKSFTGGGFISSSWLIIIVVGWAAIFPLTLLRNITVLGFTSALAVLAIVFAAGYVTYRGAVLPKDKVPDDINWGFNFDLDFLLGVPIIAFGFQCHILLVPVCAEMRRRNIERIDLAIVVAMIACLIIYVLTGLFGYYTFGSAIDADFLNSYETDAVVTTARLAFVVVCIFSYPLLSFNARLTIRSLFFGGKPLRSTPFLIVTTAFFAFTMAAAITIPGITVVFQFVGSTSVVLLMFVFPGIIYLKDSLESKHAFWGGVSIIFGIVLGAACTGATVRSLFK